MTSINRFLSVSFGILISSLVLSTLSRADDAVDNYILGEGIRFDKIQLSGYTTIVAELPSDGQSEFLIDDLSLFVNARFNRFFNPFFEAEIALLPLYVENSGLFSGASPKIVLERLYNDSHLTDEITLRLGKSLTPIGEWNGIHAGPLVPTSTRPLTSFRSFSEFVSGVSFIYTPQNEKIPTVTTYWQPEGSLSKNPHTIHNRDFHGIKGVNLAWEWGFENKLGLSMQKAALDLNHHTQNETQTLIGANLHLVSGDFDFQSEFTHVWLKNASPIRVNTHETGVYAQGLYNLNDNWALMGRYEYFNDRDFTESSKNVLGGVKYSPRGPIVLKLEYVKNWGQKLNITTGLYASLAVMF